MNKVSGGCKRVFYGWLSVVLLVFASGCGGGNKPASGGSSQAGNEEETKPEDRPFIEAANPFYEAIATSQYDKAYEMLSSHARARMSLNQFKPGTNDADFENNEKNPIKDVSSQKFAEMMRRVEKEHGKPKKLEHLHVHTTDAAVLSRKSKEELGAIDSLFAIGAMPDSVPHNIRKASLRGHILTELSSAQLATAAKDHGMSVEDLKKDEDFKPYFTLKAVLVEEDGALKVGYFEFLPPSMMD